MLLADNSGAHRIEAQRIAWAAEGLARGFVDKSEFADLIALADAMEETSGQWWAPRHDQPWRYAR